MTTDPKAYQMIALATGLRLYARTGMKPNRDWTPKAMMAKASELTGQKFKARDFMGAADALRAATGLGSEVAK